MPWNLILPAGTLAILLLAWLFRRRQRSTSETMPDVGQPPPGAGPIIEPRLQDIGSGSYELPLSDEAVDYEQHTDPSST